MGPHQIIPLLRELLQLLPDLKVIVLMGGRAWLAGTHPERMTRALVKKTWMPSAMSFNVHKKKPEMQRVFQEVAEMLKR